MQGNAITLDRKSWYADAKLIKGGSITKKGMEQVPNYDGFLGGDESDDQ